MPDSCLQLGECMSLQQQSIGRPGCVAEALEDRMRANALRLVPVLAPPKLRQGCLIASNTASCHQLACHTC
jgi:hypothetical protein